MLCGLSIHLRPLEQRDLEPVRLWRNSADVRHHLATREMISATQQQRWFDQVDADSTSRHFIIDMSDADPIGLCSLTDIDHRNQRAQSGLYIASQEHRGNLFGVEAYYLLLDYAFSYLNLRRIYGHVLPENDDAVKMNKSFGARVEGTLREHLFYDGAFHDYICIGVLADEFYASKAARATRSRLKRASATQQTK